MEFFFVRDYRLKYRFFSSEPEDEIQIKFSRWRELWEKAKEKLMLLPQRVLSQEKAFWIFLKNKDERVKIFYSGNLSKKRIKLKFYFFLQKQRTKHIFYLVGEILLLPLSALAALLPGPNVFFGVLALLIITHWKAMRGISRLRKKRGEFISLPLLEEWERAVMRRDEMKFLPLLEKMTREYGLKNIQKILWR